MYKIIKTTFKLFIVSFFLSACGGGVEEHFSQNAPDKPVINIAADDKNKWLVSFVSDKGAEEYQLFVSDSLALTNPIIIIVDSASDAIDVKKLLEDPENQKLLEASNISINPGESIFLSVVGSFAGKTSQESNVVEYVVQPDEPTGLTQVSLTGNSEIKWSKAATDDNSVKYNIYWSTNPNVNAIENDGSSLDLDIPNFLHDLSIYENGQKIYYVIYRVQGGVESSVSNTIEVVVSNTPILDTPTDLQATINNQKIVLSWTAVDGAESYRIFRNTISTFTAVSTFTQTSVTANFSDSLLLGSTDYYYWVMAVGAGGSSELSSSIGPYQILGEGNIPPAFSTDTNISAPENSIEPFVTIIAIDPQDTVVTYALDDDSDKAVFAIDALLGTLKLNFPHDFETAPALPYQVEISATSQGQTQQKTFLISISNVNEAPSLTVQASYPVAENTLMVATITGSDPEDQVIMYSIKLGVDSSFFEVNENTGELKFSAGNSPNFEDPNRLNRLYNIILVATDGEFSVEAGIQVEVLNTNDNAPQFVTLSALPNYVENSGANGITIETIDADGGDFPAPSLSINGGADAAQFNLSGNLLTFKSPPDYENPTDANQDNRYLVQLDVDDGKNTIASQIFFIEITDVISNLTAPKLVTVPIAGSKGNFGKVIIKWPYIPTNRYYLYYSTQSGLTPANFRTLNATKLQLPSSASSPYTLTGLTMSTPYFFIMTAATSSTAEESAYSNEQQATPYIPFLPLNDTGQKYCATNNAGPLLCNNVAEGTDQFPGQDAEFGLDANTNPNGFRFTKLDENGSSTTGIATCIRDDNTGLIWELKTNDGGLHDKDDTYSWYSTDTTTNSGYSGAEIKGVCSFSGGMSNCNTEEFVSAVNSAGLCGATNWRVPDVSELYGILNHNILSPSPLIETTVFPNTISAPYWTNATAAVDISISSTGAWYVNFKNGTALRVSKSNGYSVRLVH